MSNRIATSVYFRACNHINFALIMKIIMHPSLTNMPFKRLNAITIKMDSASLIVGPHFVSFAFSGL